MFDPIEESFSLCQLITNDGCGATTIRRICGGVTLELLTLPRRRLAPKRRGNRLFPIDFLEKFVSL
jgi:hypothetical protein